MPAACKPTCFFAPGGHLKNARAKVIVTYDYSFSNLSQPANGTCGPLSVPSLLGCQIFCFTSEIPLQPFFKSLTL